MPCFMLLNRTCGWSRTQVRLDVPETLEQFRLVGAAGMAGLLGSRN